jgi:glycosyltransferase involved in cell wall biosynthesis
VDGGHATCQGWEKPYESGPASLPGNARPIVSVIVVVDGESDATRRSLADMSRVIGNARAELIVASRERWKVEPAGARVVVYNAAPRGDCFDRAAEAARGEILAFTDDHVRLPRHWIGRVIDVFDDSEVVVAGGPIVPRTRSRGERVAALIVDRHISLTPGAHLSRMQEPHPVTELAGSNLVVRRDAFWAVGGFQSPSSGGEAVRLCYKIRTLLDKPVLYHPALAVSATARAFPRQFLSEMSTFGRARGDLARRLPDAAPPLPYLLPVLLWFALVAEIIAVGGHLFRVALVIAAILATVFVLQAINLVTSKSRVSDRLCAVIGFPLVPLAYGLGFVRGYLGPSMGEISPPRRRARPLRVLIINWRDVTHPWAGGAETYMHEMGQRWVDQGLQVDWLCQRHKGSARVDVIDGIRVHRVGGRLTLYPRVMLRYALRLHGRFDVVVDCENGIPFFSPVFARVPKVLVVHHIHHDIFSRETKPPIRWVGHFLEGWAMPRVYRNTQVVAVSKSTKDDLVGMGFDPGKIAIIHNGVQAVEPSSRPQPSSPQILCMGRLTRQKCVDAVLRAMPAVLRQFPEARLDIVGQGPDRTRLETLAWSLKLANHVRFHGYLPGPVRDEIASRAWIAVCPSSFEGWGVTAMESSARGLPVVASNVHGLRDSVRHGETGLLVPVDDPQALAQALCSVLADRNVRLSMGAAGVAWAARHSWDRSAYEMRTLLAELAGKGWPEQVELPGRAVVPIEVRDELVAMDAS